MDVNRGDVVLVAFGRSETGDSRPTRPCVVVQNDVGNEHASTTVVVPLTTAFGNERYPHEVLVRAGDAGLSEHAVALCSQPNTVDVKRDVVETLGRLPEDVLLDVDRALEYSLDLGGPLE
ncbi:growth inhibitor [Salinarchaeum sp. Harcht-Bsk1]|uniref:type II toxin-antitoxin system PemK/MazF family toxin n=1 Tax=Salinarchaeum sp. Harcht-Bsk1 TaxID=1333523 RepID=UPI0003423879|nr:type II toxin-antitoxin system PemK/MazF family toxin [Salinarchaeum sp. Harcht-Bsk1]AGN02894.1 growth inhibitor [Salinarchaeum sp. Harcht-Bsk1]